MHRRCFIPFVLIVLSFTTGALAQDQPDRTLSPITPDNAAQLTQLTRLGRGFLTGNITWSPDSEMVAVSGYLGVWVYSAVEPNTPPRLFAVPESALVRQVEFSPDGRWLAAIADDQKVRLWDAATGVQQTTRLDGFLLGDIAFGQDNRLIAYRGWEGLLFFWDHQSDLQTVVLPSVDFFHTPITTPDGRLLMFSGGALKLWEIDPVTGAATEIFNLPPGDIRAYFVSPDGAYIATFGYDKPYLHLWDTRTGDMPVQWPDIDPPRQLAFSPDGKHIAVSDCGGHVEVWDIETGQQQFRVRGHRGCVNTLAFSPDGQALASGGDFSDPGIRLWDVITGKQAAYWQEGHGFSVISVDISPDGSTLATAGSGEGVLLWDITAVLNAEQSRREPLARLEGDFGQTAFSPDGQIIAAGGIILASADCECVVGGVQLYDSATHEQRATLQGYAGQMGIWIQELDFHPTGSTLATVDEGLGLWDVEQALQTGFLDIREDRQRIFEDYEHTVTSAVFSPDGDYIAFATNEQLTCFDSYCITDKARIRLWDVAAGVEVSREWEHSSRINALTFSPDGTLLAAVSGEIVDHDRFGQPVYGDDNVMKVWDVQTGEFRGYHYHDSAALSIAFSPDGRLVASGNYGGSIQVFDLQAQTVVATLTGHKEAVYDLAFSPDGRLLVSGGRDGTARFWGIETDS